MRVLLTRASLAILPLAVWPGLEQPFSDPKLAWLVVMTVALWAVPLKGGHPRRHDAAAGASNGRPCDGAQAGAVRPSTAAHVRPTVVVVTLAWVAVVLVSGMAAALPSFEAMALAITAPMFAWALARHDMPVERLLRAQVLGATGCAIVALAQWCGFDPFEVIGWHAPIDGASVRMRVYGTLGNPNFVGVLMASTLPLTAGLLAPAVSERTIDWRRAWPYVAAAVLQALALVATGSRGAVLGLAAAMALYAALRWSRRVRLGLAAVVAFALLAVLVSPARPLDTTVAGRLHLWRIVARHAIDAPIVGLGPGAVPLKFAEWQRSAARDGVRDARFAGLTDHVHNDYLEVLVERGVPGLLTLCLPLALVGLTVVRAPRPVSPLLAGTAAAVAAGAACAIVDFPLARPAELTWWWVAVVMTLQASPAASAVPPLRHV